MSTFTGLSNRVAIVTGGADSIGAVVATSLHRAGVMTMIADVNVAKGEELSSQLGEGAKFLPTDLASQEQIQKVVDQTVDEFKGIDFIINAACIYADSGLESSQEEWMSSFQVNVVGGALLVSKALPYLKESSGASIINFGSISSGVAQAGRWTYPATKAAIQQLTKSQALDLAPFNIRVNTIRPGITWSAPVAGLTGGNRAIADQVVSGYQPLGRVTEADEVAECVLFLCSDSSSFVTGTELAVDGGYGCLGPEAKESAMTAMIEAIDKASN
jgi:NAD(P)-dependent dehydrogenase (short-subunit alcohol dehydrogenase family)